MVSVKKQNKKVPQIHVRADFWEHMVRCNEILPSLSPKSVL